MKKMTNLRMAERSEIIDLLETLSGRHFPIDKDGLHTGIMQYYDEICQISNNAYSPYCTVYRNHWLSSAAVFDKELFSKTVKLPFENYMVNAPAGFDMVLKKMFGDYLRPVKGGAGHKYGYEDQEKRLYEMMGFVI